MRRVALAGHIDGEVTGEVAIADGSLDAAEYPLAVRVPEVAREIVRWCPGQRRRHDRIEARKVGPFRCSSPSAFSRLARNRGAVERHRRGARSCADGEMVWSVHASQLRDAFACPLDLEGITSQRSFACEPERPRRGSVGLQRRIDACRQQRIAITDDPFVDVDRTERGARTAGGVVEVPIGVASRIALQQHVRAGQHDDVRRHPQQRGNAEGENRPRERSHWGVFDHSALPRMRLSTATSVGRTPIDVDVADRHGSLQPGACDQDGPRSQFHGKNATRKTGTARIPKLPTA